MSSNDGSDVSLNPRAASDTLMPDPGRHPYYVVTPRYTRTSAGVRALHLLCHWLNISGQSAFVMIYPDWDGLQVHPDLLTPVLTEAIVHHHFAVGATPVVIYPEVLAGNPFDAPVRVRWIANRPGLLGGTTTYEADELCYAYSQYLAALVGTPDILTIPVLDTRVFQPTPAVPRSGTCFYAAKYQAVHGQSVTGVPNGCVEITRDDPDRWRPQDIADLFRRSELFYCFEDTALINEAALCGCPVVMMPNPFFSRPLALEEVGHDGYAWGDDPAEIARARSTVGRAYDNYARNIPRFFSQLQHFTQETQRRARATPYVTPVRTLRHATPSSSVGWRKALGDRLLEIAALRSPELTAAQSLWLPELALHAAASAVTPVAGWGSPTRAGLPTDGPCALLAIIPPPAAHAIELQIAAADAAWEASCTIEVDDETLVVLTIPADAPRRVVVPVIDAEQPLLITVRLVSGHVMLRAVSVAKATRRDETTPSTPRPTALQATIRLSLYGPALRPIDANRCSARVDGDCLMVEAASPDPTLTFSFDELDLAGRSACLWGVYDVPSNDELQVFVPEPRDGFYSEALSARTTLKAGVGAFVLALPAVDVLSRLRLDPIARPGRISFRRLELVISNAAEPVPPVPARLAPIPQLDGHVTYSLLDALAGATLHRCSFAVRDEGLRIRVDGRDASMTFSVADPVIVPAGCEAFVIGRARSRHEEAFGVALVDPTMAGTQNTRSTVAALHRGEHQFLVRLPEATVLQAFRVTPLRLPGEIDLLSLTLAITRPIL